MVEAIASRTARHRARPARGRSWPGGGPVAVHRRQVQQHGEPGGPLHEGANRGAVQAHDEVVFPVPGHGAIRGLGGPLADHDLRADELLAAPAGAGARNAQRPAGAQARGQLAAQRAAALDIQSLVDRLVRDAHSPIIGEVGAEPVRDLLRAPRPGPSPVGTPPVTPPDPADIRPRHGRAVWPGDRATEPVLHVLAQRVVRRELADLGPAGAPFSMPLCRRRPVRSRVTAG